MPPSDDNGSTRHAGDPWFTTTRWSLVLLAGHGSSPQAAAALEQLCRAYWYPLYTYVRRRGHGPEDAQDLTQGFFAALLAGNYLATVRREKGRFRSFLPASLQHYLLNERDRILAQKRGGGQEILSLDDPAAEERFRLEPSTDQSPDKIFERRWALTLLERGLARLRAECAADGKAALFDALKCFLEDQTAPGESQAAAERLGMTPGAVSVAVHRLRQRYREMVREEIAQTVATPAEVDQEMRHLLAALSG